MKVCGSCGQSLPTDAFYRRVASNDGLASRCIECVRAYKARRYQERKAAGLIKRTDAVRLRERELRRANPERVRAKNRRAYERSRDDRLAKAAEWRRVNPERHKEAYRLWLEGNTEHRLDLNHEYRARKRAVTVETVEREKVFERDGWVCQLCGLDVDAQLKGHHPMAKSLDHIVPLAKGGDHSYRNVQLAHMRCNSSKGARQI